MSGPTNPETTDNDTPTSLAEKPQHQHIATDTSELACRVGIRESVNTLCGIRRWEGTGPSAPMCPECARRAGWN